MQNDANCTCYAYPVYLFDLLSILISCSISSLSQCMSMLTHMWSLLVVLPEW